MSHNSSSPTRVDGLDLSPKPGAAPRRSIILSNAKFEFGLTLRNGEQLLLTLIIPVAAMLGLTYMTGVDLGTDDRIQVVVPGIIALAILATAFTSQAISTGFDRRYGVLKLMGATPLLRSGLLISRALAILAVEMLQIIVILVMALFMGWSPTGNVFYIAIYVLIGTASFTSLALALAGTLRAEATLAVANAIFLALMFVGGILIPLKSAPEWMSTISVYLPSGALGEGLREAMSQTPSFESLPLLVLVAWMLVGTALTVKFFRWE